MGAGPVSEALRPWGLELSTWDDIQGLVYGGLASLPLAKALFLELTPAAESDPKITGGAWLKRLRAVAEITTGRPIATPNERVERAAAIAFTATGLSALGITATDLSTFARPFREGMHQADRRRRLGDEPDPDEQRSTVVEGGLVWSGNVPAETPPDPGPGGGVAAAVIRTEAARPSAKTVHVLVLLYHADADELAGWERAVRDTLGSDARVVHDLDLDMRFETLPDDSRIAREHFGFADGLGQPVPHRDEAMRDRWHGIPVGEVLIGYPNAHHEDAPGPVVSTRKTERTEKRAAPGSDAEVDPAHKLAEGTAAEGFRDIGLNGSYLVVRELRQDVAAFWTSLDRAAAELREAGAGDMVTAEWLAERVVGRERDGKVLRPPGVVPPDESDDSFGFFDEDRHGLGCPLGSHARRCNPRDGLAPTAEDKATLLTAANSHRLMRRGRKYGPTIADRRVDDGKDRGLLFMCLNTDIVRQFEFVQQTWILNKNFATLFEERDPLVGPKGPFTIPRRPLREIIEVETYVNLAAGEYFFLPSIRALDYLGAL